jgi:hypothetical protein
MNSDDRLRQAFDDLQQRTESVDPQYSLQRISRASTERRAWVPALAGAAVVLAVIGGVALSGLLSGPEADDVVATTVPDSTTLIPDSTTTSSDEPATTTTSTVLPTSSNVLPTHRVTGVASDDVLNVRVEPGVDGGLLAELPPDYRGIRTIDNIEIVEDGGEWRQVILLDPIRLVGLEEPLHGAPITGWVNSAFIEPHDPSMSDAFPCGGQMTSTIEATGPAPDHVYAIRQFGLGGCIRTVVTFGQNFDGSRPLYDRISTDVRPAGIPNFRWEQVNGVAVLILEDVPYAWATESNTHESSAALVGRWTDGSLAIFLTVPGSTSIQVSATGDLVVDVNPFEATRLAGNGFHILGEPVAGPGGTIEMWGLARPFEANVGTTIIGADGDPVEGAGPNFVMTTDWTEAWGLFQYRAVGLEPGAYVLTLSRQGVDQSIELDVPFMVQDRDPEFTVTEADLALTDGLRAEARGVDVGLPFADDVTISLGIDHEDSLSDPADGEGWIIDVPEWNGYAGPFDVLGPLRDEAGITATSVGPQPHCAGPPLDLPWDADRQLTIQPAGISSCLEWYAISLFLNDAGEIERVMLDLWEP